MIERIFHFADATPDQVAIYRHGTELTYRQFADAIGSARTAFAAQGVTGPGVVALETRSLLEYWVHAFALNTLGLTTIAVRAVEELGDLPLPNLRFVLRADADAARTPVPHAPDARVIMPPPLDAAPSAPTPAEMEGCRHLLFSSGTTGQKKMMLATIAIPQVPAAWALPVDADTVYHLFDFGPWTLAGFGLPRNVWNKGGAILVHQGDHKYEALRDLRGTHATLLPHSLNEILDAPEGAFPFNLHMQLTLGGGAVTLPQVEAAKRRICPVIFTTLASTEVSTIAITRIDTPDDLKWHDPLPGRGVEVVDDDDRPVPPGEIGHLRLPVGTHRSAYHNDQSTTAAFFRDGFFYPGDLAVMRADGRVALQGRVTEVINLDGSKINPQPFELMLEGKLGLRGCCLLTVPDPRGAEVLFLVVEADDFLADATVAAINDETARFFGGPVAGEVLTIRRFPRTDTGKVVRRSVQAMIAGLLAQRDSEPVH